MIEIPPQPSQFQVGQRVALVDCWAQMQPGVTLCTVTEVTDQGVKISTGDSRWMFDRAAGFLLGSPPPWGSSWIVAYREAPEVRMPENTEEPVDWQVVGNYTDEEGRASCLGVTMVQARTEEEARTIGMDQLWDSRLDAVDCIPQFLVLRVKPEDEGGQVEEGG